MAELGSDENKKPFLANFNTLQAMPKKKKKKTDAEKEAVRLSYKRTGRVRNFIQNGRKNFRGLKTQQTG